MHAILSSFRYYLQATLILIENTGLFLRFNWSVLQLLRQQLELQERHGMADKTYQIGLYLAMHTLYRYMSRWQPKLVVSMTTDQYTCFQAVLAAIVECLPLILPAPPTD